MIPWCFWAHDKGELCPIPDYYYAMMSRMPIEHPEVHEHFSKVAFRSRSVARIPLDGFLWTRPSKRRSTKTPRHQGPQRLQPERGAVARYYLTSEYRSRYLRQLRAMVVGQKYMDFSHPDLQMPRIRRDEADVQSLVQLMETSWLNPFKAEQGDLSVFQLRLQHHQKLPKTF
ncbi:hypothetical protein GWK47_050917 [Chionoecetes opilio]|uniref:Uncharacterized protein n=1 Tax=Chionoecetes opilio TaxID=41210 RepID=A0A8J4YDA5_CHIOP|nr:hypothetical protein GWK47_050917 [Chionoecetes opilio]